jgi:hypothetical protein
MTTNLPTTNTPGAARPSTLGAIRAYCKWCCDDQVGEVHDCPATGCPLWAFRFGHNPRHTASGSAAALAVPDGLTARRAIGLRCSDCHERAPGGCPCPECPPYQLRPRGRLRAPQATTRPLCEQSSLWTDLESAARARAADALSSAPSRGG